MYVIHTGLLGYPNVWAGWDSSTIWRKIQDCTFILPRKSSFNTYVVNITQTSCRMSQGECQPERWRKMRTKTLLPEYHDFGGTNILYPIPSRAYPNWSIKFCADVPQICFKLKTCIHKIAVVDVRDWCRQGKSVFRRNPVEFQGETARPWRRQKRADAANSLWIQVLRVSLYLISVSHHVSASWNPFVY